MLICFVFFVCLFLFCFVVFVCLFFGFFFGFFFVFLLFFLFLCFFVFLFFVCSVFCSDVAYKFFLADPRNEGILKTAKEEAEKYGDIVFFENFHDTYRNITRKSMGLVKWFVDHYDFDYLFKTDDDAFLRTDRLLEHLKTAPKEKYYTGISIGAYTPDRNPNSLYYVSEHDFPRKTGPSVIVGAGYVISHDCAEFMAKKAVDPKTIFIPLEDVNTAVVLEEYGVEGIPFNKFKPGTCPCTNDMILTHWCSPAELHKLYKKTKDTNGVSMC
eukprot:Phypoly_transcript_07396.p1 GENE.Phypoly_transcript_07396~~Phypoly_transcript_07396.p1  ORF type:complete len:270 (+),score=34.58 Phypoly_transcript_07396:737-1546(+)